MTALAGAADARDRREVITPEGVPISFVLAPVSARAGALMIDLLIQIAALVVLVILAGLAFGDGASWVRPLVVVAAFLILNFYFAFFELRWQGATPGKRALGLRVIDARGGVLEPSAILGRNLMRELELWMPLRFLLAGSTVWPGAPWWAWLLASTWTLVFLLLPLFNRDHLRVGDLVAGTWVVVQPKPVLLPDLAALAEPPPGWGGAPLFTFTDAQLRVYGEYELQVLEQALRRPHGADRTGTLAAIAEAVHRKIRMVQAVRPDQIELFLHAYYSAVRTHLEKGRLFGKRKADKFS
ncbi:MAG: RDD family protein [Kofleriaceae bacterium]